MRLVFGVVLFGLRFFSFVFFFSSEFMSELLLFVAGRFVRGAFVSQTTARADIRHLGAIWWREEEVQQGFNLIVLL